MDIKTPLSPKKYTNSTSSVRLTKSTIRTLNAIVKKINSKKKYGRSAKADDVIQKALTLLKESHLEEIKELTYSSKDKLEIQHKKYCETHGNISKDEFLQLLLSKALPEISNQPTE